MLKKLLLLAAILLQFGLITTPTATADELPEPSCWPCAM